MKEGINMENKKFERIIFMLLRVLGVLSIIGGCLSQDRFFSKGNLIELNHKSIIGNVYMISPNLLVIMIVTIILYVIFIRFLEKHISISKKQSN